MNTERSLPEGGPSIQELRRQKKHWIKQLLDLHEEETLLALSVSRSAEEPFIHQAVLEIPKELDERLRVMSGNEPEALFLILLAAFKAMVQKHAGGETVTVSCPRGFRPQAEPDVHPAPVSWLPTIDSRPGKRTFREWLYAVKASYEAALGNGDYPLEKVVQDMKVIHERDYAFLNHIRLTMKELHGEASSDESGNVHGLLLRFSRESGRLEGRLAGSGRFFAAKDVKSLAGRFVHMLGQWAFHPDRAIGGSGWMPEEERAKIVHDFGSGNSRPYGGSVMELFEEQVRLHPDALAIVTPEHSASYIELHGKAARWARRLIRSGTLPGQIVALYLERSLETAVAMLAVMKAGACILPIDIQTPGDRIRFMLEDSAANAVITHSRYAENPFFAGIEKVLPCESLDEESEGEFQPHPVDGQSAAYIIYTSGTTGKPKGVVVPHGGLANSIAWRKEEYGLTGEDRAMQLFSYSFDGFMTGFFTPLASGAGLFLPTEIQVKDPMRLRQLIDVHRITHFICVPSLYRLLLEQIGPEASSPLRIVTLAGEPLPPSLIRDSRIRLPRTEIVNEYGPTEASVVAVFKRNVAESAEIAIGRPIANMQAYILDDSLEPVPPGIVGELCLSGPGLAEGYLRQPERTKEAFLPHPFLPGQRLYRTGDLAKWTEEGEIRCIGRKDAQVKLRGYRIELAEIEQRLAAYPGISAAAAICEEEGGVPVRISAYLQCGILQAKEIRDYLAGELPSYMIPSRFYRVGRLPLSDNGKTDKKALPALKDAADLDEEFIEPRNETERLLAGIFSEVLSLGKVSAEASFFEVGGHSLKATMLMARIQKAFEVDISIDEIFEKQTVSALAEAVAAKSAKAFRAVTPAEKAPSYPLSSAQKRMYALYCRDPRSVAYNMSEALLIDGDLDKERLKQAVAKLVERHEILRTTFAAAGSGPVQVVHEDSAFELDFVEGRPIDPMAAMQSFVRPFDLEAGPLFRIRMIRMEERKHLLLVDLHHILADGSSVGLFISELARLYNGERLAEPALQYKDFAVWQHRNRDHEDVRSQERYWLSRFADGVPSLELPSDFPRPKFKSMDGARISFTVDAELAAALKRLAGDQGATLFMVLLSVYNLLLSKLSGQEDLVVGTPVSGRVQAALEETMGMFVNVVPIRTSVEPDLDFVQLLARVKKNALGAFENQLYPYDELAVKLDCARDLSRNPLFDVMFVLQNMQENRFDFRGLHFTHAAFEPSISKFDLTLAGFEGGDGLLYFDLEYSTHLFRETTARRIAECFLHLLRNAAEQPGSRLDSLTLLPADHLRRQLEHAHADVLKEAPASSLPEQFRKLARLQPDRTAIMHGKKRLTYGELDELSDRWAAWLLDNGVGFEDVVAVRLERSFESIVCFLALLKSGAAYLPIDPAFPVERARHMLEDSRAVLLITDGDHNWSGIFRGKIAKPGEVPLPEKGKFVPAREPDLNSLAYIIYTSGTTGKPKGVALEHAGLANLPFVFRERLGIGPDDVILQFAPCSFDASVWEFSMALGTGGSLCLASKETIGDPELFRHYAEEMGITAATFPPSYMERLQPETLGSLRLVVTAGSEPSSDMLREWSRHMRVANAYGPTEASVCAAMWDYAEDSAHAKVPVGKPIPNSRICIVDAALNPLPPGVAGQLGIAGIGLAREYLNQPEITARQFVRSSIPGFERMYLTGDLAKRLEDGSLVYLGRIDSQLKIRGCRVEPGEIESRLTQLGGVKSAAVRLRRQPDGRGVLAAYYSGDAAPNPRELKAALSGMLPGYMVPALYFELEELPLTVNGKVDGKALDLLQQPGESPLGSRPPAAGAEALVAEVFEEVLAIKGVGADDTFNELGGDSISAMKAVFLLKKKGFSVEVRDLLLRQTPAALSRMKHRGAGAAAEGEKAEQAMTEPSAGCGEDAADLADIRRRLAVQQAAYAAQLRERPAVAAIPILAVPSLFLTRSENVGAIIPIPASRSRKDIELTVLGVVRSQEMLRCFLSGEGDGAWSLHGRPDRLDLPYVAVNSPQADELIRSAAAECYHDRFEFDQPGSLLYRLALIENGVSGEKVLVYSSHHSLSDGLTCSLIAETIRLPEASASAEYGRQPETGYRDYVEMVEAGPQGIPLEVLERRFQLDEYRHALNGLEHSISLLPAQSSSSITLEFPLDDERPEQGWHTVLGLVASFGKEVLRMDALPVRLVSSGRRYGSRSYYHLAGNFIDYIPVLLRTEEDEELRLSRIRELIQTSSIHNIHFAALDLTPAGRPILLNFFGAVQKDHELEPVPYESDASYEQAAADYGISFYARHTKSGLRVDIALPFVIDADRLGNRLAGKPDLEILS